MVRLMKLALSVVLLVCIAKSSYGEGLLSQKSGFRSPGGRHLLQIGETAEPSKPIRGQFTYLPKPLPESRRFCGFTGAPNESCDKDALFSYGEQIALFAVPGIVLLVLSLLSLVIFFTGRCCCNLFGGRQPSPGVFCGGNEGECCSCFSRGEFEGYTRREQTVVMVLAILFSTVLIFVPIQGFVGSSHFHQGVSATVNNTYYQLSTVSNRIASIEAKLAVLPYVNATEQLESIISDITNVNNTVNDNKGRVDTYESIRMAVMYAVFGLVIFMGCLGVIAAALRVFRLSHCLAVGSFFVSALVWLIFAIHLPLDLLFIDSCAELGRVSDHSSSLLPCINGTIQQLAPAAEKAEDGLNTAFAEICSYSAQACSHTYCSVNCSRANAATYNVSIIQDVVPGCFWPNGTCFEVENNVELVTRCPPGTTPSDLKACPIANLTVANCSTECHNGQLRNFTIQILYAIDIALQYEAILEQEVLPLVSCQFIGGVSDSLAANLCGQIGSGVDDVATSSLVIGCFLAPFTILMLLAFKRLRRGDSVDADESSREIEMAVASPPPKLPVEFEVEAAAAELMLIGSFNRWAVAGPDSIRMQPCTVHGRQLHRAKVQLTAGTYDYAYHDPATRQRVFDKNSAMVGDVHTLTVTKSGRAAPLNHSQQPLVSNDQQQEVQENSTAASYQPAVSADYRPPQAGYDDMLATPSASAYDPSQPPPAEEPQFDDYAGRFLQTQESDFDPAKAQAFSSVRESSTKLLDDDEMTASRMNESQTQIGMYPSDTIYMSRPSYHNNESHTSNGDY